MASFKKIFQSTDEKLELLIDDFRKEYGSIFDFIIVNLDDLEKLGYDDFLVSVSKRAYPPYFDADDLFSFDKNVIAGGDTKKIRKYIDKMRLRNLAKKELIYWTSEGPTNRLIYGAFEGYKNAYIEYAHFSRIYLFLERLYCRVVGRKLGLFDLFNVYFSGLDESITFNLDKFDINTHTREPTAEFFKKLDKIKNPDQEVVNCEYEFRKIMRMSLSLKYGNFGSFARIEEEFVSYLAGCSAVNDDRSGLTIDDYITAYRTYYKLLKTDVTQYRCKRELFHDYDYGGYLMCKECNGYYKLEEGEFPDDFDKCQCGGELEYKIELN
ncbi:MAG: hypothetical protein PQ975_02800 [Methanobacterium sp.]